MNTQKSKSLLSRFFTRLALLFAAFAISTSSAMAAIIVTLPTPTTAGSIQITQDITFDITTSGTAHFLVFDEWVNSDSSFNSIAVSGSLVIDVGGVASPDNFYYIYDNEVTSPSITAKDGVFQFNGRPVTDAQTLTIRSGTIVIPAQSTTGFNPQGQQTFTGNVFLANGSLSRISDIVPLGLPPSPEIALYNGASTAAGDLRADDAAYIFGGVDVGEDLTRTFTIKNTGTADLTSVAVTSTNPSEFTVTGPSVTTLAPDASTTFTVTFAPSAESPRSGVINIASNDADTPFQINATGTGLAPGLSAIIVVLPTTTTPGSIQVTQDITFDITTSANAYYLILDEWVTSDTTYSNLNTTGGPLNFSVDGGPDVPTPIQLIIDNEANGSDVSVNDGQIFFSATSLTSGQTLTIRSGTIVIPVQPNIANFNPQGEQTFVGNVFLADAGLNRLSDIVDLSAPPAADYAITTTGNQIIVTDEAGNSDTLTVTRPAGDVDNIAFAAAGRTFSVDGGPLLSGASGTLLRTGMTDIIINAGAGDDIVTVGAVAATGSFAAMPNLTINGGLGDDRVNLNGDLVFALDANLNLDLQNDEPVPGADQVVVGANANVQTSGSGSIVVKVSRNVDLATGSSLETVNGGITVEANQQAVAVTGNFNGVGLLNADILSSGTGLVSVVGKGGTTAAGARGVFLNTGAVIQGGTAGTTVVTGVGGTGAIANNYGVTVQGASSVTSLGADVSVTGTGGGSSTGTANYGIFLTGSGSAVSAAGSGAVTVSGTSGVASGTQNQGVNVTTGCSILSAGGNVSVTGVSRTTGSGTLAVGVEVSGTGKIASAGAGTLTVTGTGSGSAASAHGVYLASLSGASGTLETAGGDLWVTGTRGTGGSGLQADALASISGGEVTVVADQMGINATASIVADSVVLQQKTAGRNIGLGAADSATLLGLTDAELDRITADSVTVGDSASGTVSISAVISPLNYDVLKVGKGVSFAATGGFSPAIESELDFQQLEAAGVVTIAAGATLTPYVVGGYEPAALTVIPLVVNTGSALNSGIFLNLPEASDITLTGLDDPMKISYRIGPGGNDIAVHLLLEQTLAFSPRLTVYVGDTLDLTGTAVGSSGGLPSYRVVDGPAVLDLGNVLSFSAPGTVEVAATQLGDATYAPAVEVVREIAVLAYEIEPGVAESWRSVNGGAEQVLVRRNSTAKALALDLDGEVAEFVAATGSRTNAAGNTDIFTAKYDAQSGAEVWSRTHAGAAAKNDEGISVAVDSLGNVVIAGTVTNAAGNTDIYVAKYAAATGAVLWQATYAGNGTVDYGNDGVGLYDVVNQVQNGRANLKIGPANEVIVGGYVASSASNRDLVVIKYSAAGARQWVARYDEAGKTDHSNAVVVNEDGDVFVAGGSTGLTLDAVVLKYNGATGLQEWERRYDGGKPDEALQIALDRAGNAVIGGYSQQANYDFLAAVYDGETGAVVAERTLNGPAGSSDAAWDMKVVDGDHVVLTGASYAADGAYDGYTVRFESTALDAALPVSWGTPFNGSANRQDQMVALDADVFGNPVVTGYVQNVDGSYDAYTAKYDGYDGSLIWQTQLDGPGSRNDFTRDIAVDPAGNVYVAGYATAAGGSTDFWVSRYQPTLATDDPAQVITFNEPGTQQVGTTMLLLASASSGLPVSYSYTGPATLSGNELTLTASGTVTVTASQAGDGFYAPAVDVTRSFEVIKGEQVVVFTLAATAKAGETVTLGGSSTSGLPLEYSVFSGPGSIAPGSNLLNFTGTGTVVVSAGQPGNSQYNAAASVQRSIVVSKSAQVITFTPPTSALRTETLNLVATSSSGLSVNLALVSGPGILTSGGELSFTGPGNVTVRATQAGDDRFLAATAVQRVIVSVNVRPTVNTPISLATVRVGQAVSGSISATLNPTRYYATGLPPGVLLNATTGVLSGIPTAARTVSGMVEPYEVTFTASNSGGTSDPVTVPWLVEPMHPKTVGIFNGLVEASTELSFDAGQSLRGLGGRITLTSTGTGSFSGSLGLETKSHAFTGKFNISSLSSNPTASVTVSRGAGIPALTLAISIDQDSGQLTGTLTDGMISTPVALSAWHNGWSASSNPATAYAAAYTGALELGVAQQGDADYPQGNGFGSLSVTTAGIVKWVGKMGDSTAVTISTTLGPDGQVPLFLSLYTTVNTTAGSVHGWAGIDESSRELSGSVNWTKQEQAPASTTRLYKQGFPTHRLTLLGGEYIVPAPGSIVLDLSDGADNAQLVFAEGGLGAAAQTQDGDGVLIQVLRINSNNTVTMPGGAANPTAVTLTLNAGNGAISGKFTLSDANPAGGANLSRTANYSGVLVNRLGRGLGHFILAQLPTVTPPTTLTNSPQLSGQALLDANP